MFDWCIKNIEGISFLFVSSKEVEEIILTCEPEKQYAVNFKAPKHIVSSQKKTNCQ